ncbi:MAG: hypothetical protein KQJ78_19275 [Deltaproteobacteria bacterium]|nr:hypothetical protein [Deltaproteobacteria bacterium]
MDKLLLEITYKASYCLLCVYMEEAVYDVLPEYAEHIDYRRIDFLRGEGRQRFLDLSVSLFGYDGVYKHRRIAPIPSLWLDGEMVFDGIPPRHELLEALEEALAQKKAGQKAGHRVDQGADLVA